MDLLTLVINLEKEPKAYTDEFRKQVKSFLEMCRLPKQPTKALRQTLDLLINFSFVDKKAVSEAIVESVTYLKEYKLKKIVLSALLSLTYKRLIPPSTCIKAILEHSPDPSYFINKIKTIINKDCEGVIKEYYEIGNEKQKTFCYYFILLLFYKNLQNEICNGLFEEGKIRKLSFKYFLENKEIMNHLDENCKSTGRKIYDSIINHKEERELKIMKMKIYVLFKNRFGLKPSIIPLSLTMIDPTKEDVKDLMNIVVDSVTEKEVEGVLKSIGTHFCSPFKEEDMICYGLNLMRYIYLKFDDSDNEGNDEGEDEGSVEGSSLGSVEGSSLGSVDEGEDSVDECKDNVDKCKDNVDEHGNNTTHLNTTHSTFLENLKDTILNYVECFRDSKIKSITYSYRAVINVIKKKKNTGREINFILRKLTKEERLDLHKKNKETNKIEREMYKAEKKELSKKKSKRKFKLSKKRLKINARKRL